MFENLKSMYLGPGTLCDLIFVKLATTVGKILYSHGFSGHCLQWPWPLTF